MNFAKEFVKWFVIINTGIFIILIPNTWGSTSISPDNLWEALIASAVTSLITAIFFSINPKKEIPKIVVAAMMAGHFVCLLAIMLFLGNAFGWIEFNQRGVLTMTLSVAGVYICAAVLSFVFGMQDAKKMNKALEDYRKDEEK